MLRLIRPLNLFIIALTMYLMRYCIIQTQLRLQVLDLQMEDADFALLTLSVILIAAAGYIINDIFDTNIDTHNKVANPIVNGKVSKKRAMNIYIALNICGALLGGYTANKIGVYQLVIIHLLTIGLLWFYSSTFKCMVLVGNIVIAVLSAVILFIPILFEPNRAFVNSLFILGYAIFAFMLSLMREIIKDNEDIEGDEAQGCRTFPIVSGKKSAKTTAAIVGIVVAILLAMVQYMQFQTHDNWSFIYFLLAIQLPLIVLIIRTMKASVKLDFHRASTLAKIVMLTGILSMLIFKFTL